MHLHFFQQQWQLADTSHLTSSGQPYGWELLGTVRMGDGMHGIAQGSYQGGRRFKKRGISRDPFGIGFRD